MKQGSLTTEDKVVLLLTIVPFLIENGTTHLTKISERFDVSEKQIRELAFFLGTAGIPGESNAYLPGDLFDIDWDALEERDELSLINYVAVDDAPKFSGAEAASLIAGLNIIKNSLSETQTLTLEALMAKLSKFSYRYEEAITAEASQKWADILLLLTEAIRSNNQISFDYIAKDSLASTRLVDPVALKQLDNFWYLEAYCHDKKDTRLFRVEAMQNIKRLAKKRLVKKLKQVEESQTDSLTVVVRSKKGALHRLASWQPTLISEYDDGSQDLAIQLYAKNDVFRLIAQAPGLIQIIEPEQLRNFVISKIETALSNLKS